MSLESLEVPSDVRLFGLCLVAAAVSIVVVVSLSVDAWLLFPMAIVVFSGLTFLEGYRQTRSSR